MNTIILAPRLDLPVTGVPFGDTPAREVDDTLGRMRRKARYRIIALAVLGAVGFALFWHVGQPFWGNWPQVQARVTSHYEYVAKGVRCSLGLDFAVNNETKHSYFSTADPCNRAPAIGSLVQLRVDPGDPGWVILPDQPEMPVRQLVVTGMALAAPILVWALLTCLTVYRLRMVSRLGEAPWHEVTGAVVSSTMGTGGLCIVLRPADFRGPDAAVTFGTRGISFFPLPKAGDTLTLRLAGDGSGKVLVGIPGHWGESVGTLAPSAPS